MKTFRPALAEIIGTFALCFFGAGSICMMKMLNVGNGVDLIAIALTHAIVLSVAVSALMGISGGQFNPAVTFGLWIARKIETPRAAAFVVAQLVGATAAGFCVKALFPAGIYDQTHGGTPGLGPTVGFAQGVFIEALLTFFLVISVFGTAVSAKAPKIGGFGIGLTLFFDIIVGGPFTGASMNPARTFGPGLAAAFWDNHLVYWIGPLLGSGVAAWIYEYILGTGPDA